MAETADHGQEQPGRSVQFGRVDASDALMELRTVSGISELSTGEFRFDFGQADEIVDYFGELCVTALYQGKSWPLFTGAVTEATPVLDGVRVRAASAPQLRENVITDIAAQGVTAPELIHALARGSGIRQERLKIGGLESLPRETFEVTVPVDGVTVEKETRFAEAAFLPADHDAIGGLEIKDWLRAAFTASAYARASVTATTMLEAEEKGLAAIDLALAWLTVQLRSGAAMLPAGNPVPFHRQESLAQPSRRGVVRARGVTSGRHWLRRPAMAAQERTARLRGGARPLDDALPSLTLQEKLAFLALGRAARESDLLARVHSLWEAIEFYCSGITVDPLFTASQVAAITGSLPVLDPAQQKRATDLIGQLNSAPLLVRLKQAIKNDNAPVTESEVDLLRDLRQLRNKVVHGKSRELPIVEDVDYATSVVARLLIYRARTAKRHTPAS